MDSGLVLYRCHGNSVACTVSGMDYQCRDCGGTMREDGVWYRASEFTALTKKRDELREAGQAVVDCFGCGGDSSRMAANLAIYIADLAKALGDERASKALAAPDRED